MKRFTNSKTMLKTYDLIKKLAPKLGEDEAKDLIYFVEEVRGDVATKADLHNLATKADLQSLKADLEKQIQAVRTELKAEIQTVQTELKTEIQNVRTEIQSVRTEIQTVKSDILKWMIGIWITIIVAIFIKNFL